MYQGCAVLSIRLFRHPHLLKGSKRGEDGASNVRQKLAIWARRYSYFDRTSVGSLAIFPQLVQQSVTKTRKEGTATCKDYLRKERASDINALHYGCKQALVYPWVFCSENAGLEEAFRRPKALTADLNHATVGKLIRLCSIVAVISIFSSLLGLKAT